MTETLADYLARWAGPDAARRGLADTVEALAQATIEIAFLVADGALSGDLGARRGAANADGDDQKELDVRADEIILGHLARAPVAAYASEENDHVLALTPNSPWLVACDPLDGSSNIDTNVSIGTIFSVLPAVAGLEATDPHGFLRRGREQAAAGYAIYGPQTALVMTLGEGTAMFTLDRSNRRYVLVAGRIEVPATAKEFAINMSNYRHWDKAIRSYIDHLLDGHEGPHKVDYNMRWIASMVAEAHRILMRGGIFLYPADRRKGYQHGRLRLVYEGNPIAMVMEQAGAAASDGVTAILDLKPTSLHQRTPLVFGSRDKVGKVAGYIARH